MCSDTVVVVFTPGLGCECAQTCDQDPQGHLCAPARLPPDQ